MTFDAKKYYNQYYKDHREELKKRANNYYYDHLGYFRNYYIENRERYLENMKKHRSLNYSSRKLKEYRLQLALKKNQEKAEKFKASLSELNI